MWEFESPTGYKGDNAPQRKPNYNMTISIETKKRAFVLNVYRAKLDYVYIFPTIRYNSEEPNGKYKASKHIQIRACWLKKCISLSWQVFIPLWATQKD